MTRSIGSLILVGAALTFPACRAVEVESGTKGIAQASEMQCHDARRSLEQAVENFDLLEGHMPRSEAALVPKYLVTESSLMDLDAKGNVVAAPGSGCT